MTITNEQWQEIEKKLKNTLFARVTFKYKNNEINVVNTLVGDRLKKVVYINNEIKGAWDDEEHPMHQITKEVWFTKGEYLYTREFRNRFKGRMLDEDLNRKISVYSPIFGSIKTLIRQYKKLKGLELIQIGV
ncbi:hypothetical protein [Phocoenobacter skyensis]|uniref:Uncharacterized protein n=1 Tax=Phocoenobacter skyensis TaxID=97481 RepID=A0ABT9JL17_9PAST|nr:hypothetical protein [Pasteurella skyensis]MDP8079540.1 hypothetical protein [Pasteurella skyensis]MDP8085412.1 hypothetical protein [Pasteurella skyensis]